MSFTQEPTNTELSAPSPCDVSRRNFLKLIIAAGGTAAAASALPSTAAAAETPTAYPEKFTFAVMSDVHYLSPDLIAKNASYEIAENSDRKMFSESADILDRALDVVVEQAPDMVIVPGDLTKDGEYLCHEQVAERYRRAQEAIFEATDKQTKFYVINGNHDLNNHHAKDFASAGAEDTVAPDAQRTNPTEYKTDIWADFGYPEATAFFDKDGTRDGSLSYVVRPCPGLTLIVVDSCSYNLDGGDGTLAQETQDGMTQELLDWVCAQAKAAKAAGDVVVAMQHHGIVEHFGYEDEIFGEYLVNKNLSYTAVAEAYADAGISAVFTGHMHANDIAAHTSAAGNTVYDIETGSLVTYPSYMRTGSFEFMQKGDELECTLTVDSKPLDTVSFDLASQGGLVEVDSADITEYGKERTLTVESVTTMLNGYVVDPLLAQVEAGNGIKATIAGLLGCEASALNGQLWSLLTSFLPTSIEDAIAQGFYISKKILIMQVDVALFFNAESGRIEAWQLAETPATASALDINFTPAEEQQIIDVLSSTPSTMAEGDECALYINADDFSTFLDALLNELDQKVLLDTTNGGQQALRTSLPTLSKTSSTARSTTRTRCSDLSTSPIKITCLAMSNLAARRFRLPSRASGTITCSAHLWARRSMLCLKQTPRSWCLPSRSPAFPRSLLSRRAATLLAALSSAPSFLARSKRLPILLSFSPVPCSASTWAPRWQASFPASSSSGSRCRSSLRERSRRSLPIRTPPTTTISSRRRRRPFPPRKRSRRATGRKAGMVVRPAGTAATVAATGTGAAPAPARAPRTSRAARAAPASPAAASSWAPATPAWPPRSPRSSQAAVPSPQASGRA
ncbi:metallophosphoesterase [uncultured Enorma sp.]|uniref:metallophosphoesterase family protein n=1 Tax=uncultured Enorma sp. TaxID=1714346 RepID=UPI00265ED836|nr:metallophosphoesterase [uncultured Enorma sp.]